jgi:hypothetical protein
MVLIILLLTLEVFNGAFPVKSSNSTSAESNHSRLPMPITCVFL